MKPLPRFFVPLALLALLAGPLAAANPGAAPLSAKAPAGATNKPAATNALATVAEEAAADPVIRPGDKISFRIKEDPYGDIVPDTAPVTPTGRAEFRVSRKYKLTIPLEVGGKSLSEVKQLLKEKLDADYYANATLELSLTSVFGPGKTGKIHIYGDGVKAQMVTLVPGEEKRILEVVLGAGTTEFAQLKKVKLLRRDPQTDKVEITIINIEEMKKTGSESKNILLQDGDKIEIPDRTFVF